MSDIGPNLPNPSHTIIDKRLKLLVEVITTLFEI
jgi:hypothetical protein